jgi:hypothetical protein
MEHWNCYSEVWIDEDSYKERTWGKWVRVKLSLDVSLMNTDKQICSLKLRFTCHSKTWRVCQPENILLHFNIIHKSSSRFSSNLLFWRSSTISCFPPVICLTRLVCSVRPPCDDAQPLPCQLIVNVAVLSKACIMAKSESSLGQDAVTTLHLPQSLQRSSGQYLAWTKSAFSKIISNLSFATTLPSMLYL